VDWKKQAARAVNRSLRPLGVHLVRSDSVGRTWDTLLHHLTGRGFRPHTVVDVGAAGGTLDLYRHFPTARYHLYEPLSEYRRQLARTTRGLDARIVECAVGDRDGEVTINVHADLIGSSIHREVPGGGADGPARLVPMVTLDRDLDGQLPPGNVLVKIDVQGAELAVLRGARRCLRSTEVLIVECSLIPTLEGAPEAADVVGWLAGEGFSLFDVIGGLQRPLDGALSQLDLVFVPRAHPWRADRRWRDAQAG
jgi:FkbM family methyltransferase